MLKMKIAARLCCLHVLLLFSQACKGLNLKAIRRVSASLLMAGTVAATALTAQAVDFSGSYTDPKHPGCERNIDVPAGSNVATLTGTDGTPGCTPGGPTKAWKLMGAIKGNDIFVDFSPKGGPKNLEGVWDGDGIKWPDGNKWLVTSKE